MKGNYCQVKIECLCLVKNIVILVNIGNLSNCSYAVKTLKHARKQAHTFDINQVNALKLPPIRNTIDVLFQITEMQRCRNQRD